MKMKRSICFMLVLAMFVSCMISPNDMVQANTQSSTEIVTADETSGDKDHTVKSAMSGESVDQLSAADVNTKSVLSAVWDGSVDLTWYDAEKKEFHLTTPAQLAGLAAIVNGRVSAEVTDSMIAGDTSLMKYKVNNNFSLVGAGGGNQSDTVYVSDISNDFAGKTIYIDADMDMGGVYDETAQTWSGPNWTPIGGRFPMDTTSSTGDIYVVEAYFNGTIEGNGHQIKNLYCNRYTPKGYAYSHGVGFIGAMGDDFSYDEEEKPEVWTPSVRNLVIQSGHIEGRRMVGGLVGGAGEGTVIENCANKAEVSCTDSNGIGGILAQSTGKSVIRNCYNTGTISTTYTTPAAGILGTNGGTDIYNCYNVGKIQGEYGRSIGSHGSGTYTVANCYYLDGVDQDETKDGYAIGTATTLSISVTKMSSIASMQDPAFVNNLNLNGKAFVASTGNYPVLYFEDASYAEKKNQTFSVSIADAEHGSIQMVQTENSVAYGRVIDLKSVPEAEYKLDTYKENNESFPADFYMVTEDTVFSAEFIMLKKGAMVLQSTDLFDLYASKSGSAVADGKIISVSNEQCFSGDVLYQNDSLKVKAELKKGAFPEDENMEYTGAFTYTFQYEDETTSNSSGTYTVKESIDQKTMTVTAVPTETYKRWMSRTDTDWYTNHKNQTSYTITTAEELAGLAYLVNTSGVSFEGKTIRLGNSISLENNDGTCGTRYWSCIGSSNTYAFKGTFDGMGYTISGMNAYSAGSYAGLFGYCMDASIKNVIVKGSVTADGGYAGGIAGLTNGGSIENCTNYASITSNNVYAGGILAVAAQDTTVSNCINHGTVSSVSRAGGIVGESSKNTNSFSQCANYGTIHAGTGGYAGGIAGYLCGSVEYSVNQGAVSSEGKYIGGLVGYTARSSQTAAKVIGSVNGGTVTTPNNVVGTGGLIGYARYIVLKDSYNTGSVISSNENTGGVVGLFYKSIDNSITNTYYLTGSSSYGFATGDASAGNNVVYDEALTYVSIMSKTDTDMKASTFCDQLNHGTSAFLSKSNIYPVLVWLEQHVQHTVTYTGAYEGTELVYDGEDVVLPRTEEEGQQYVFTTMDEAEWNGKNITQDMTIQVTKQSSSFYVSFIANGKLVEKIACAYGQSQLDASAIPDVPELSGYTGVWQSFQLANKNIAVQAVYSRNAETVVYGGSTLTDGDYYLAASASGIITIAQNATVTLDGNKNSHENLAFILEEGATLTIQDVQCVYGKGKALVCKQGSQLVIEGTNSICSSGECTLLNEYPAISIEGNVIFQGTGVLYADAYEKNAALSVEDAGTFNLESGTVKLAKGNRFNGCSGGTVYAPKGTIIVNGGILAAVSHTDNLEAIFAHSFIQNGGLVYAAALDASVPIAVFAEQIQLNGGSLKAETRKHTTGDKDDSEKATYTYDIDTLYTGTITYGKADRSDEIVAKRESDIAKLTKLSGYYVYKIEHVADVNILVDGNLYYSGGTYPFGFDAEKEVYTDASADDSLYLYLKNGTHTLTVNGVNTTVSTPVVDKPKDPENTNDTNTNGSNTNATNTQTQSIAAPAKVTGLKASAATSVSNKLSWKAVSKATGYQVIRYSATGKQQKTYLTTKTSLTIKKLSAGTVYKYKVRAYVKDEKGNKKYGSLSSAITCTTKPVKVTVKKVTTKNKTITVKWKKITASGYQIQISTSKKFKKKVTSYPVKSGKTVTKTMKKLKKGTTYYIRVRAYKTLSGKKYYGSWSNTEKKVCK